MPNLIRSRGARLWRTGDRGTTKSAALWTGCIMIPFGAGVGPVPVVSSDRKELNSHFRSWSWAILLMSALATCFAVIPGAPHSPLIPAQAGIQTFRFAGSRWSLPRLDRGRGRAADEHAPSFSRGTIASELCGSPPAGPPSEGAERRQALGCSGTLSRANDAGPQALYASKTRVNALSRSASRPPQVRARCPRWTLASRRSTAGFMAPGPARSFDGLRRQNILRAPRVRS